MQLINGTAILESNMQAYTVTESLRDTRRETTFKFPSKSLTNEMGKRRGSVSKLCLQKNTFSELPDSQLPEGSSERFFTYTPEIQQRKVEVNNCDHRGTSECQPYQFFSPCCKQDWMKKEMEAYNVKYQTKDADSFSQSHPLQGSFNPIDTQSILKLH